MADHGDDARGAGGEVGGEERGVVGAVVDGEERGDGLAAGRLHAQGADRLRAEAEQKAETVALHHAERRHVHRDGAGLHVAVRPAGRERRAGAAAGDVGHEKVRAVVRALERGGEGDGEARAGGGVDVDGVHAVAVRADGGLVVGSSGDVDRHAGIGIDEQRADAPFHPEQLLRRVGHEAQLARGELDADRVRLGDRQRVARGDEAQRDFHRHVVRIAECQVGAPQAAERAGSAALVRLALAW